MSVLASVVDAAESASDRFGQLDGRYLLPLKAAVRTSLGIVEGDIVPVQMVVGT